MKKLLTIFAVLCLTVSLCACGQDADDTEQFLQDVRGDIVEATDRRMAEEAPESLRYLAGAVDMTVTDSDSIRDVWAQLNTVRLGRALSKPLVIDDGDVAFCFRWADGTEFTLEFCTSAYYVWDGAMYPVLDPSPVQNAASQALDTSDPEDKNAPELTPLPGLSPVDTSADCYTLDLDGDGEADTLSFRFVDNGDEAYGALELTAYADSEIGEIGFYPALLETVSLYSTPLPDGRTLLVLHKAEYGGWEQSTYLMAWDTEGLRTSTQTGKAPTGCTGGALTFSDSTTLSLDAIPFEPNE